MSIPSVNYYKQHCLLSNRIVQYVGGLNPNTKLNDQMIRNLLLTAWVFPLLTQQMYLVYDINMDFQSRCSLLQIMVAEIHVLCTYVALNLLVNTIHHLMAYIKYDYEQFSNVNELNILKKYTKFIKILMIIIIVPCSIYNISLTAPSIFGVFMHISGFVENVNLTLPFPVNKISSPGFVYYNLLVYQISTMTYLFIIGCTIYLLYFQYIQHACIMFRILILKIREPFKTKKFIYIKWDSPTNQEELEWTINIIKNYTRVIEYIELINRFSKMLYLMGIFFTMIIIFFDILYILKLPIILQSNIKKMFEYFISIFGTLSLTYVHFFFGQMLIDHSKKAFEELCQVPFYMLSIKSQKLFLFLIARSIKPCELSIGGLYSVSHEIFAELMKKSFSFAMAYHSLEK